MMVAYDPRRPPDPSRSLTPATREALRAALLTQWKSPDGLAPGLHEVIRTVAAEARDRGIRPEELIIDLKALEDGVAEESKIAARTRARVREWIVAACVKAYFGVAD